MTSTVHVAVGVIFDAQQKICIAKRPDGKHLAGLWEFPGGKVEEGESVQQALKRELYEELAITINGSKEFIQIRHQYPTKTVLLDVHTVHQFDGEASGSEGQVIQWAELSQLDKYSFPEANKEIIQALLERYLVS